MSDIKYAYPLILNKVASPHYANPVLRRARLIDWLNDAANCRAVVLAADAGYGKTTLLWQWEREVEFPCFWYKLDRTDRDWTFHISYLIEAISKRHKGFGRRAHSMLQQMGGPGSSRPGVAAYLLAEMHQRLTEPCTFIIDDWQYVNPVTEVRGLWNQILRDAPPTCRFVFASRVKPKLQFARFKTHGGYAELRTDALRFADSEISDLFQEIYNDPLDTNEVTELERRTEGWAASLQLVEVSLRDRVERDERLRFIRSISAATDNDLFDFLAEEVLDQQPDVTRNFLLSTSILQQITPEVAERLTGSQEGLKQLADLEELGLFTNRLDAVRFRYHNLFREFLERRLNAERTDAEVSGLHIHAASYFETSEQWPEAIHHYLRAGLQRQAARLIARYGEEVVAEGRLGLVDEWLRQIPNEAIRSNARLSLLFGEASGVRGEWDGAIDALQRARSFFARKGDARLEALACLKLSSVYSNYGDPVKAAEVAGAGVALVPADAYSTRLRLEGNLAITRTWLSGDLEAVLDECRRIAVESAQRGLDHFTAIALHNAGEVLNRLGRCREAVECLTQAAQLWAEPYVSPFADNLELVTALLDAGDRRRARREAEEGVIRTRAWPRPNALALLGSAAVDVTDGQFDAAIKALEEAGRHPDALGPALESGRSAALIEALFLSGTTDSRVARGLDRLEATAADPRHRVDLAPALAIGRHITAACRGECLALANEIIDADRYGANSLLSARVKVGVLKLMHGRRGDVRQAWLAANEAVDAGRSDRLRPWLRMYARFATTAVRERGGASLISRLAAADPDGWREALMACLPIVIGADRDIVLTATERHANRQTIEAIEGIEGRDVAEMRRRLRRVRAARLYLRTFGGVSLHRGNWTGPVLPIEKKRVRMLLALLAARSHTTLTRDAAVDLLWPEADVDAAINSLNQTVYQLRRYIEPSYRGGDSPEYVISTADQVALNPDLVRTDLEEVRRLPLRLSGADWSQRQSAARRAAALVRGEFLADLRYEEWTTVQQLTIHNEVRERLLPIAKSPVTEFDTDVAALAASALLTLDSFDEAATIALADCLTRSGRRVAARELVVDYIHRLQSEFDEAPSQELIDAAQSLGVAVKPILTEREALAR